MSLRVNLGRWRVRPQHQLRDRGAEAPAARRRRCRGGCAGRSVPRTVVDTEDAFLLHVTGLSPPPTCRWRMWTLTCSSGRTTSTHCPFRATLATARSRGATPTRSGSTTSRSTRVVAGGLRRRLPRPFDRWLDEDEEVQAFPDPYHRVDIRSTSAPRRGPRARRADRRERPRPGPVGDRACPTATTSRRRRHRAAERPDADLDPLPLQGHRVLLDRHRCPLASELHGRRLVLRGTVAGCGPVKS